MLKQICGIGGMCSGVAIMISSFLFIDKPFWAIATCTLGFLFYTGTLLLIIYSWRFQLPPEQARHYQRLLKQKCHNGYDDVDLYLSPDVS